MKIAVTMVLMVRSSSRFRLKRSFWRVLTLVGWLVGGVLSKVFVPNIHIERESFLKKAIA